MTTLVTAILTPAVVICGFHNNWAIHNCYVSVTFLTCGHHAYTHISTRHHRFLLLSSSPSQSTTVSFPRLSPQSPTPSFGTNAFHSYTPACLAECVGCLTSQQHASVSQGRICTDNFTRSHTEKEVTDETFHLTQSQYTDTGPTSPSTDPITPDAWQGSYWSASF